MTTVIRLIEVCIVEVTIIDTLAKLIADPYVRLLTSLPAYVRMYRGVIDMNTVTSTRK